MRVVGDSWRSVHAFSALLTSGGTALVAWYVFTRSPGSRWRLANAASAALLMGLNILVLWYGTIGQAYGLSLFLLLAAVALTVPTSPSEWDARRRLEWRLCGWLFAGPALFLTTPLPTAA